NPLVLFGASQAIFFALFTANGAATSVMEERNNGTLQRLLVSPTPRLTVMLGKMTATFVTVLAQLTLLFVAFTLVGSLLAGELQFIWGQNLPGIALIMVTTALATTGLGSIIAAIARTPDQSSTIGSVISIVSAVFGGAFGFQIGAPFSYFSVIYWGTDAFTKLASGQTDYALNALVLLVFGATAFTISLVVFNRRMAQ
ncbi:MAG: ABC transporter permease, partial [Armatimonadetes bacterium]|nr:ABC transporter permease [Anaerolineae bacterium]